jgi:hypothetical protein
MYVGRSWRPGASGPACRHLAPKENRVDIPLAVNGTLIRGLELNPGLRETTTAAEYRPWSIGDVHPAMIRVATGGAAVTGEVWHRHGGWRAYLASRAGAPA